VLRGILEEADRAREAGGGTADDAPGPDGEAPDTDGPATGERE
jgi:hypothetical protein